MSVMRSTVVLTPIRVVLMIVGADGGFQADYGLLAEAAKGIDGVISQLSDLGIVETGQEGRGFALLDLAAEGLGVTALASAFSGFTGTERYLSGVAKAAVNAAWGDPRPNAPPCAISLGGWSRRARSLLEPAEPQPR
jgi:hypothetical protein